MASDATTPALSAEQHIRLHFGANAFQTAALDDPQVPPVTLANGPHGVGTPANTEHPRAGLKPATCFPTAAALAATWDTDLMRRIGVALGDECRVLGVDVLLGPGINIKRSPLGGRNFEYYSEDPLHAGRLAAAWIQGVQSRGVGTSLKHFVANNQETLRTVIDTLIDERALREIYLAGFEVAIQEADPWTVMSAYNRLDGDYASESRRFLHTILREEWGYTGVIVSDWGAVHDSVKAVAAGLDLEMPGPVPERQARVSTALESGNLDRAQMATSTGRLLALARKAAQTPKGTGELPVDTHHALARQAAAESVVLLKNTDHLLPLKPGGTLAVIGPAAKEPVIQGIGSSTVNPTRVETLLEQLAARDINPIYAEGYDRDGTSTDARFSEAITAARRADTALFLVAAPGLSAGERTDRRSLSLPGDVTRLIEAVAAVQPQTIVIVTAGSAVEMPWHNRVPAILFSYLPGQAGAGGLLDVLFGDTCPSGRLTETFPHALRDTPAYLHFPGELGTVRYAEGLFVGYRYYDTKGIDVLYPFGYGLSYTSFAYSTLTVSAERFREVDGLTVSVDVSNSGERAGSEVVQLYVRPHQSKLQRPDKELKAFAKIALQPGETRRVSFTLDERAFAYYHPAYGRWVAEAGPYDLLIARDANTPVLSQTVELIATKPLPFILSGESSVEAWLEDPAGAQAMKDFLAEMPEMLRASLDGVAMLRDMPLKTFLGLLGYFGVTLEHPTTEVIERLIAAARSFNDAANNAN